MGQYSQACKLKQEGKSLASLKEADTPDQEAEEEDMECEDSEAAGEATHWSQLDTKSMKVADLRTELNARGQPSKGVKLQLAAKLQACLDEEKVKEESKDRAEEEENTSEKNDENETHAEESSNTDGEPKEETAEEVTIVLDERQKEKIASAYKTPSNPCIFVIQTVRQRVENLTAESRVCPCCSTTELRITRRGRLRSVSLQS